MRRTFAATVFFAAIIAGAAQSATVEPIFYNMRNGGSDGENTFRDDSYSGRGNMQADRAWLRRGLGDLTDGIIATGNWDAVESANGGPYVGWHTPTQTMVFKFDQAYLFNSAIFHFDGNGGANGSAAPRRVRMNGEWQQIGGASDAPFAFAFDLSGSQATDRLRVKIQRARNAEWTFLSEVTFDADIASVPLPAGILLIGTALAGLGVAGRRRWSKKKG